MRRKLRKQMGELSAILCILTLVFSVFPSPVQIKAAGNLGKGKPYKETQIAPPKGWYYWNVGGIFVNAKGKIRIHTVKWEQTVYGISGKKGKEVSDPMVKAAYNAWDFVKDKERDTQFYLNTVNKKGTAGYFTNGAIIFKYNKKGIIQKRFNTCKKLGGEAYYGVRALKWVSGDKVAALVRLRSDDRDPRKISRRIFLIDMGKGKIIKKYSAEYDSLCGTDGKHIYVMSGSITEKTEKIVKLKASSGRKVSSISTQIIRALAEDRTEKNGELFCKDESFDTCYSGGKLYLRYLTGIYTWNEKKKRFDIVLDGIRNKNYNCIQLSTDFCFSTFEVVGKKMYVAGSSNVYMYSL